MVEPNYPFKDRVDFKKEPLDKICEELNTLDKHFMLKFESEIKEDLQSYDILKNEKYQRMDELKRVLDHIRSEAIGKEN